ncbi:hypothetical protein [Hydrogenimonas sp.]
MTHADYAKELNAFSYKTEDLKIDDVSDETMLRIRIGRLYYALFHRIINELPDMQASTSSSQHSQVESRLERYASNGHTGRVHRLFKDLKTLRVWADYQVDRPIPKHNMTVLLKKTYTAINSKKIFP